MKKLPEKVFIILQEENTKDEFLNAHENIEDILPLGEPNKVGIYELKEVKQYQYKLAEVH